MPNVQSGDDGDMQIAKRFNAVTKYVASRRSEGLTWQNTRSLDPDAVAGLRELKRQDGPILLTQGSSALIQTLLAQDLIDELRLVIFSVTLGRGKRLFGEGARPAAFRSTSSTITPGGVVIARYERAGAVKTGSFAT